MTAKEGNGNLGTFHGNEEGYAKCYTAIAGIAAVAALAIPWMNILLLHRHGIRSQSSIYWANALSATVIWTVAGSAYIGIYRTLGRLVAKGGSDAVELDRLRRNLSSLASGLYSLMLVIWWSGILSHRL